MKKKLQRDKERAVVSGVVAGMANYFDQDPILFRVAAITFLIFTGVFPGLLLYLIAWFMIPNSDGPRADYEIN